MMKFNHTLWQKKARKRYISLHPVVLMLNISLQQISDKGAMVAEDDNNNDIRNIHEDERDKGIFFSFPL